MRYALLLVICCVGCGGHSMPTYVSLASLNGVYVSQTPNAGASAIHVAAKSNVATITGYAYTTMADAQAAAISGLTSDGASATATGVIRGAIGYTDENTPHANSLAWAIQTCAGQTCAGSGAPMYSGRAHVDSLGNLVEQRENYSTQETETVLWYRQNTR